MLRTVAVAVSEPVPAFELGVVSEVFGLPRIGAELPGYGFSLCAEHRSVPLRTTSGFAVAPTHGFRTLAAADLVVVLGTASVEPHAASSAPLTRALRAAVARGATVASLCTGAFTLAAAGLLDGRRATTHWAHTAEFAARYPAVTVEPDSLYVVDGPVATSAGASAAIDLCVHLVRTHHGADVANRVARELVMPAHRNGGQVQYARMPVMRSTRDDIAAVLDWARQHLDADLSVARLATRASMSPRTFVRRFVDATGTTPAAWVARQRLAHAEHVLETSDATLDAVARRCGFGSSDTLHRQFVRAKGITPEEHRRAFAAVAPSSRVR